MRAIVMAAAMIAAVGGSAMAEAVTSPFPVERGTAPPPPLLASALTSAPAAPAPPEGVGAGGVDFGPWRGADPSVYGPAFEQQMRARSAGKSAAQIRADLEANGFACEENGVRLQCRIEIMERQCGIDWYAVLESGSAEPIAGFDVMCLGAR